MLGVRGHVVNRKTGRPEPHHSWPFELIHIGLAWFAAAVFGAVAALFYASTDERQGPALVCGIAILFASLAFARMRSLKRKRLALEVATRAWETGLQTAFD